MARNRKPEPVTNHNQNTFETALALITAALESAPHDPTDMLALTRAAKNDADQGIWIHAICRFIDRPDDQLETLWPILEFFIIESGLVGTELRTLLEDRLFASDSIAINSRISIYSILRRLGSTRLFGCLHSDEDLRRQNPGIWIDLLVASAPETPISLNFARSALLSEVSSKTLDINYLADRLRVIAKLGTGDFGGWIAQLKHAIGPSVAKQFDSLIDRAFVPTAIPPRKDPVPPLPVVSSFTQKQRKIPDRYPRMQALELTV
jgi:hypothetical protein